MYKRYLILVVFFGIVSSWGYKEANADEREVMYNESLSNAGSGGFGGAVIKLSEINSKTDYLAGLRGAWLINHQFYLGGAAYGSVDEIENTRLDFSYAGLLVGFIANPNRRFHYSYDFLIGGGQLYHGRNWKEDDSGWYEHGKREDGFFVIEPGASLSLNLAKYLGLEMGISYRLVDGSDDAVLSDSDLSGFSVHLSFIGGKF